MGLEQIGTGTVIVTGNETYTGQTTIGSGDILQIGNNGTAGSINGGSISDSGTLAFDLTNPTTTFGLDQRHGRRDANDRHRAKTHGRRQL